MINMSDDIINGAVEGIGLFLTVMSVIFLIVVLVVFYYLIFH